MKSVTELHPVIALLLGALVPLIIGSLYAVAKRFVSRRISIYSPEAKALERIEKQTSFILEGQNAAAATIQKMDQTIGFVVPALKIVVKKVRLDLGRIEEGEDFNGDLEEAWEEIKQAEKIHRGMRKVEAGGGE